MAQEGPAINRDEGTTLAFSKAQASKLLEMPTEDTITSLRECAGRSACRSGCIQGHHMRDQRLMQSLTSAVNRPSFPEVGLRKFYAATTAGAIPTK